MSHTMMIWQRVVEGRLREEVMNCGQQHGLMQRNITTEAIFVSRKLKYTEGLNELHCAFSIGKEEIHGCGERGYADSLSDRRRRCRGQGEM